MQETKGVGLQFTDRVNLQFLGVKYEGRCDCSVKPSHQNMQEDGYYGNGARAC
jgi:hypothetical protein